MESNTRPPFHPGEEALQTRLGVQHRMAQVGARAIRDYMPDEHRHFFAQLPFILVGSIDAAARPWASLLVGKPGFIQSPDPRRLDLAAQPKVGDPLLDGITLGAPLGFLGIELHTRRRNRMNGRVCTLTDAGFSVQVDQSVGNCPKYIQGREYAFIRDPRDLEPRAREEFTELDHAAQAQIAAADTLFVATHAPGAPAESNLGADVSHRGGRRGFVKFENSRTLLIPDFVGNFLFMTLGNLLVNPRAGLLFIDFEGGDLLYLTGHADILWDGPDLAAFDGAERGWRLHVECGRRLRDALPLRWTFREYSEHTLHTGNWGDPARP